MHSSWILVLVVAAALAGHASPEPSPFGPLTIVVDDRQAAGQARELATLLARTSLFADVALGSEQRDRADLFVEPGDSCSYVRSGHDLFVTIVGAGIVPRRERIDFGYSFRLRAPDHLERSLWIGCEETRPDGAFLSALLRDASRDRKDAWVERVSSVLVERRGEIVALTTVSSEAEPARADLSFFTGHWRGRMGDALIEEIWSGSEAGGMIGMFRMTRDGVPRFFEFMSIEPDGEGRPQLHLRHFSPGLAAWEEKEGGLVFDVVSFGPGMVIFRQQGEETRLAYELVTPDQLVVRLEKGSGGESKTTRFTFERQPSR